MVKGGLKEPPFFLYDGFMTKKDFMGKPIEDDGRPLNTNKEEYEIGGDLDFDDDDRSSWTNWFGDLFGLIIAILGLVIAFLWWTGLGLIFFE